MSGILHTNADAYINNSITVGAGSGTNGNNTAFGYRTLVSNTSGQNNTAIGYQALTQNLDGSYNLAVGLDALITNSSGSYNTAVGPSALGITTNASQNTAIGYKAGYQVNGISNNNTFLGSNTDVSNNGISYGIYSNSTAIGNGAIIDASNCIVLGNSAITTLKCQATSITSLSDARDKKDIQPLTNGINFIEKMNPVSFIWNMRDGGKVDIPEMGFIAQELKQVQEETGITVPNLVLETNPDRLEASYGTLLPILVKAVQELSAKVTRLETELSELKKQ